MGWDISFFTTRHTVSYTASPRHRSIRRRKCSGEICCEIAFSTKEIRRTRRGEAKLHCAAECKQTTEWLGAKNRSAQKEERHSRHVLRSQRAKRASTARDVIEVASPINCKKNTLNVLVTINNKN